MTRAYSREPSVAKNVKINYNSCSAIQKYTFFRKNIPIPSKSNQDIYIYISSFNLNIPKFRLLKLRLLPLESIIKIPSKLLDQSSKLAINFKKFTNMHKY